jgi:hypothetical protein
MERIEISLPEGFWRGVNTAYPADAGVVSKDEFTEGSQNFLTSDNGVITKRQDTTAYNSSALATHPMDQFEAVFADGTRHFLVVANGKLNYSPGDGVFTEVTTGYSASAHFEFANARGRVYFCNGVDTPQAYDKTTPYGGVTYTVPKTRTMGVVPPTVGAMSGVQAASGSIADGTYYYKVTYLYHGGQESNGSAATASITVSAGPKRINLSTIPVGGYGVESRKLYRSNDGGATFYLVATISDNTTTTYADTSASVDLTLPIPAANGLPPTFSYIVYNLDRLWVVSTATPYYLYWSEAGLPDVWSGSFLSCNPNDTITGLAIIGQQVVVFSKNSMGIVEGRDSSTFRYVEIAKVGCVDQRSIQSRLIAGLPELVWLAPSGDVYGFNGSTLRRLSVGLVNKLGAVQQASQGKRQVTQSSQADFTLGTSSPSISLSLVPGSITVANPEHDWELETDWDNALASSSAAFMGLSNVMRAATRFAPTLSDGTLGGYSVINGTNVELNATSTDLSSGGAIFNDNGAPQQSTIHYAVPWTPHQDGTLTSLSVAATPTGSATFSAQIWTDSGGSPSAPIAGTAGSGTLTTSTSFATTAGTSIHFTAGVSYWIVMVATSNITALKTWSITQVGKQRTAGVWGNLTKAGNQVTPIFSWTITFDTISGTWVSPVYDTHAVNGLAASLTVSGAYAAPGTATVTAYGSPDGVTFDVTQAFTAPNGANSVSLAARRYWKIGYAISDTTGARQSVQVGTPILTFATTATWDSEVIDHTTDITTLDVLSATTTIPATTSITLQVATSTDNISYSSYTSIGSATPHRYSKIKVTITTTADNITSASLTGLHFGWSVLGTQTSNVINLSTITGWDLFQAVQTLNGGTATYSIRANNVEANVTAQPWTVVANGAIPAITPGQYVQYKVAIAASSDTVPQVDSVTINWLITGSASLKLASMFHDQTYYLAAAEEGQTANNIVFVLEQTDDWQIFYGWSAATMGVFFGDPYFGDGAVGTMRRMNVGYSSSYSMIVITKAFSNELKRAEMAKAPRAVYLRVMGTGATFTPTISLDGGESWLTLRNPETGLTSYVSPVDNIVHPVRFVPASGQNIFGRTIMIKVVSTDAFAAQIHTMRLIADVSSREVLNG